MQPRPSRMRSEGRLQPRGCRVLTQPTTSRGFSFHAAPPLPTSTGTPSGEPGDPSAPAGLEGQAAVVPGHGGPVNPGGTQATRRGPLPGAGRDGGRAATGRNMTVKDPGPVTDRQMPQSGITGLATTRSWSGFSLP